MTNIINNAGSHRCLLRVAQTLMLASPWLPCRNSLSAQWQNTFLKSREVCVYFIKSASSAKVPHHQQTEDAHGFTIRLLWFNYQASCGFILFYTKSHPATRLFSYSATFCARPLVYRPAGMWVTTSCCWQMLLRESSSSPTLPNSPSKSIRCMTARTGRRRDK